MPLRVHLLDVEKYNTIKRSLTAALPYTYRVKRVRSERDEKGMGVIGIQDELLFRTCCTSS